MTERDVWFLTGVGGGREVFWMSVCTIIIQPYVLEYSRAMHPSFDTGEEREVLREIGCLPRDARKRERLKN